MLLSEFVNRSKSDIQLDIFSSEHILDLLLQRHQMIIIAKDGFRAIAPDFRGYELSDLPPQSENATFSDLIADLLALLDALALPKVEKEN
ncbi:hypothetical protein ACS0TY_033313 [Phlomoides rotata]